MKRISQLLVLNIVLIQATLAQAPYVIYYAVDELYTFTTQVPQNTVTQVNLSYYNANNGLVSNFYPASLYTSIDQSHSNDNEVKSNYVYVDYGSILTNVQASGRNNDKAYRRELVASVRSTYTNSTGNIHTGDYATIATFDNDMPKAVNFTKVFNLAGINGGSSQLTYGIKGTFAMVSHDKTYPKLISPVNVQLPYVSTRFATLEVPEFYKYFPESQIGWKQDGKEIKAVTGYTFRFSREFGDTSFVGCGLHSYQPFIKDPKFAFWTAGSIQIELSPNLKLGSDIIVNQPVCTELQAQGQTLKFDGFLTLGDHMGNRGFKVAVNLDQKSLYPNSNPVKLSTATGAFNLNFEEDFGNNYFSCTLKINNIQIIPPKPISISDTLFKDILCFGDKSHIDLNIDGNTTAYTLAYGDSVKNLQKGKNLNIPLMKGSRNYNFKLSDANGCVYEKPLNFTAKEPSKLEATYHITNALCHDDNSIVRIDAKGGSPYFKESPYRYTYSPTITERQEPIIPIKAGTKLSISLHDSHGCSVSFPDTTLYNPADFKLSVLNRQDNICPKGNIASIQLAGISADKRYIYSYSKDSKTYNNEPLFTGLNSGTLTFQTKNQFGCIRDTTVKFIEPPFITIGKTAVDSVRCVGESNGAITLNISGGTGFKKLWKDQGTAFQPQNKVYTFNHSYGSLSDQSYRFYAQDSLGCMDSVAYTIGTRSNIQHTLTATNPTCDESRDGQIKISNSGGVGTYQNEWLLPKGLNNELVQNGLSKGTYILRSTDKLGCAKVDTFTLTAPPALQVNLEGYPLLCKGQMLKMDAGPGVKYVWGSSKGYTGHTRTGMAFEGATYCVEVTNEAGCIGRDTFELMQSDIEFKAYFVVATNVVQGDTVVLVNYNAHIDSLIWNLEPNNTITLPKLSDFRSQEVVFKTQGEQEIQMTGYYKGCRDILKRKIFVVDPKDRIKYDNAIGIKTSVIKTCGLFPNPNDGSFSVHIELHEDNVPVSLVLSSTTTGSILKQLPLKIYPEGKIAFTEDLPEGPYVIHVKVRDEVVALRFLVAYD